MRTWPYQLVLALIMAGCAGPTGTLRAPPPPPPAVTSFDGAYRTTLRVTSSFGLAQSQPWCNSPGQPIITVAQGYFTYLIPHPDVTGSPIPAYAATFASDGSFYGQTGAGAISGRVRGNQIEGKIDGSACVYTFAGTKA
jgi:hypothetical protein